MVIVTTMASQSGSGAGGRIMMANHSCWAGICHKRDVAQSGTSTNINYLNWAKNPKINFILL
jgi:hypothetical protein